MTFTDPAFSIATDTKTSSAATILNYLENCLPGYPFELDIDRSFVQELLDDFPLLDILEEIKAFRWYHDNNPAANNIRLALRRWLKTAFRR